MPTPRDYFAKGWPGDEAVIESKPLHTGASGQIPMFGLVNIVNEAGVAVVQKAAAGSVPEKVFVAVDNYDAFDVISCALLPIWMNNRGKIIVTPHVDTTGLAAGDEMEINASSLLIKKSAGAAVGLCLEITGDDEVRFLMY